MSAIQSGAREIRVFLSSTFKDMEEERSYLLTSVFPVFRLECLERLVDFTEIDLRWGITEEEAKNGRTVEICLEEIERCRGVKPPPFFIGFLGERYGWIPKEEELEHYWSTHSASPYTALIKSALEKGISVTELEMQQALLDESKREDAGRGRIFLRARSLTDALAQQAGSADGDTQFYDPAGERLEALKARLRASPFMGIDGYESPQAFGAAILEFLRQQLDKHFPREERPDAYARQARAHALYAQSRLQAYIPLQDAGAEIQALIEQASTGTGPRKLHIKAPSGWGKSAFLAHLQDDFAKMSPTTVFAHYVGADGDLTLEGWREHLFSFLGKTGRLTSKLPESDKERWDILPVLLHEVVSNSGHKFILLLDAVNQFTDQNKALDHLGRIQLPEGAVLVMTSTPDLVIPQARVFDLPALDEQRRREAINAFLASYHKNLPPSLVQSVAKVKACESPLFLRLVLEELRLHAQHETLEAKAEELLAYPDAGALFLHSIDIMDGMDFFDPLHPNLALRAARLLAVSWRGLYYKDLARVLAGKGDPLNPDDQMPQLPDFALVPVLSRLIPFCLQDDGRIALMHAILRQSLMHDAAMVEAARKTLVSGFKGRGDAVAVAELIFQLRNLEDRPAVVDVLGTLDAMILLYDTYPVLLGAVLSWLGADDAKAPPEIERLAARLQEEVKSWSTLSGKGVDLLGWFMQRNYLFLGTSWGESIFSWFEENNVPPTPRVLIFLGGLYMAQARYDDAKEKFQKVREAHNISDADLSGALNNLAIVCQRQGDYKQAEGFYLESLEKADPNDGKTLARKNLNLATFFVDSKDYQKAQQYFDKAEELYQKSFPADHPEIAMFKYNYGGFESTINAPKQAVILINEALDIFRKQPLVNQQMVASCQSGLVQVYVDLGDYDKAKRSGEEALEKRCRYLPEGHPDIAKTLLKIAHMYQKQKKYDEAEKRQQKALEICNKHLPKGSPEIAQILNDLAILYTEQKQYAKAMGLCKKSLLIRNNIFPEGSVDVAYSLSRIGFIFREKKYNHKAKCFYKKSLDLLKKYSLGEDEIADISQGIADICMDLKDYDEAEAFYDDAIKINLKCPEVSCVQIVQIWRKLENLSKIKGDNDKAADFYKKAWSLTQDMIKKAASFQNQKLYKEAENLYRNLNLIFYFYFSSEGQEWARIMARRAYLYRDQGRYEEAELFYMNSLETCEKVFPPEGADIAANLYNFASFYQMLGRYSEAAPLIRRAYDIYRAVLPADDKYRILVEKKFEDIQQKLAQNSASDAALPESAAEG